MKSVDRPILLLLLPFRPPSHTLRAPFFRTPHPLFLGGSCSRTCWVGSFLPALRVVPAPSLRLSFPCPPTPPSDIPLSNFQVLRSVPPHRKQAEPWLLRLGTGTATALPPAPSTHYCAKDSSNEGFQQGESHRDVQEKGCQGTGPAGCIGYNRLIHTPSITPNPRVDKSPGLLLCRLSECCIIPPLQLGQK